MSNAPETTPPQKGFYLPALDGIRAVAFLMVFVLHAISATTRSTEPGGINPLTQGLMDFGRYGVPLFFVLSSFLVTSLLLRERERLGTIDVRAFVIRRGLRIWPLYYALVLLVYVKGLLPFTGTLGLPGKHALAYLTFNGDLLSMFTETLMLTHLWSIGVEEKFYLSWPWVLRRVDRAGLIRIVIGVYAFQWILRLVLPPLVPGSWFLYGPIGYLDCLALGAGLALLPSTVRLPRLAPGFALVAFFGVVILGSSLGFAIDGGGMEGWGLPLAQGIAALAAAALVATLKDRFDGWPVNKGLIELGKRSYGAYLIHPLIMELSIKLAPPGFSVRAVLARLVAFALTLAFAWLSFRYFERPFLGLKARFQRVPSGAGAH